MDQIAKWLDEELGVIYPLNPTGTVTELLTDGVLERLAQRIRSELESRRVVRDPRGHWWGWDPGGYWVQLPAAMQDLGS